LHRRTPRLDSAALDRPAIVIAPHPDDETLGCGGLIALKRQRGVPVIIVFMTDGAASHAGEVRDLAARRRTEAEAAAAALGVGPRDLHFLDIADGSLEAHSERAIEDLAMIIGSHVALHGEIQIVAPHPLEPPSDHSAAHSIVNSAVARLGIETEALLYPVWLWDQWPFTNPLAPPSERHSRRQVIATACRDRLGLAVLDRLDRQVDVAEVLERKREALAAHTSQMAIVPDQPERLTLHDVAAGEWLDVLMQPYEFYSAGQMGRKAT
jgi:LmbE family N-acetylglucosaminyl deacetylase